MKRVPQIVRPNWRERCDEAGFTFYDLPSEGGEPYWRESAAYEFSYQQIETIEQATKELFDRCMDAVEFIVRHNRFAEFGIPKEFWDEIARSWDDDDPTVYGRFDLAYDGQSAPKLLEFNADTPTSLVEAAVAQWWWMKEVIGEQGDQFNSIHEALVEQWRHIRERRLHQGEGAPLVVTSLHSGAEREFIAEDYDLTQYMAAVAEEAGFAPRQIFLEQIDWDESTHRFVDTNHVPLETIFKLYPWEWMVHEPLAAKLLDRQHPSCWIEPMWKMLLSNKQLLVVLWELFPDHPNLLPAYSEKKPFAGKSYVKKPKLSREGANVVIVNEKGKTVESSDGDYGEEGFVYQEYSELPACNGWRPVIGSWVVGETPCGMGIRETSGRITDDMAFFVPHYITK